MSDSTILLTLTSDHLETGLRGVPVGYCPTSLVDPQKGLFYKGYAISVLAEKSPEEVMYLLFHDELPREAELYAFNQKISKKAHLDKRVLTILQSYPKGTHPMQLFMAGLNLIGIISSSQSLSEDRYKILATITELTAWVYRILNDWGEVIPSKPELGYIENFVHMLAPPGTDSEKLTKFMRIFFILHLDHGGGNLSTFVGKVIASAGSDMFESLLGAMAGLSGPLHGKASQEALRFLRRAEKELSDPTSEEQVGAFIRKCLENREKIFGFGHAVLRVEDARATIQYAIGDDIASHDPTFILAQTFRKVGPKILIELGKVSNPYPNVDAVSGCLLSALGLRDENFYTVLFGMSRCIGIIAQILYERLDARGGRGTPIIRPKYIYNGPTR